MSPNRALLALLRAHGDAPPLDRAVALIAADEQPGLVPEDVLAQLDQLAAGLRLPPLCEPVQTVARLHHHLFVELGFRGDEEDYDAPRNSLLDQVLTRRRGLPILLSVVYVEVAKRRGIAVDPVGFPVTFSSARESSRGFGSTRFAAARSFASPSCGASSRRRAWPTAPTSCSARSPRVRSCFG